MSYFCHGASESFQGRLRERIKSKNVVSYVIRSLKGQKDTKQTE